VASLWDPYGSLWLPYGSHNEATLYAVVAIFGFGSGGWLSLAPVCVRSPLLLLFRPRVHTFQLNTALYQEGP
jgi:hypothetical protein